MQGFHYMKVFVCRSNIVDAVQILSMAKKNEIHYLMGMLEKVNIVL